MPEPLIILRDVQEKAPLRPFVWRVQKGDARREYIATADTHLETGDYGIEGIGVAVERKSLVDLWGSLFYNTAENDSLGEQVKRLDRLRREFDRMGSCDRRWLLIEADRGSFEAPEPDWAMREEARERGARVPPLSLVDFARYRFWKSARRGRSPEQNVLGILGLVAGLGSDYGVAVEWAGSRSGAELWLGMTFSRIWDQHIGGEKARDAVGRGLVGRLPWLYVPEDVSGAA